MFNLKTMIIVSIFAGCFTQSTHTMQRARKLIQRQVYFAKAMKPLAKEAAQNLTANYLVSNQVANNKAEADMLLVMVGMKAREVGTKIRIFLWGKNQ